MTMEQPAAVDAPDITKDAPPAPLGGQKTRILTPLSEMLESDGPLQEKPMADETNESATTESVAADTAVAVSEPKKQRAPRGSRAAALSGGTEASSVGTPPVGGRRGKQTRAVKTKPAGEVKQSRKTRQRRVTTNAAPEAEAVPASTYDEMADLLQLEEENQKLRKLLVEKLRAENAELRKRLGVG